MYDKARNVKNNIETNFLPESCALEPLLSRRLFLILANEEHLFPGVSFPQT